MKKQTISVLLIVLLLLHSCVAYQSTSVPINRAYERGSVRVISNVGESFDFNYIYLQDSIYYGVKGKSVIRLDTAQISGIYLQDLRKSKNQTRNLVSGTVPIIVVAGLTVVGTAVVVFYLVSIIKSTGN